MTRGGCGRASIALVALAWLVPAVWAAPGDLDVGFGRDGVQVTHVGWQEFGGEGEVMLVQPDGTIVVGGRGSADGRAATFALVRHLPDGSLDPTFGDDGRVSTVVGNPELGIGFSVVGLVRQPDGSLDRAFDGDGIAHLPAPMWTWTSPSAPDALLPAVTLTLTVQLGNDAGLCVGATYESTERNDARQLVARKP